MGEHKVKADLSDMANFYVNSFKLSYKDSNPVGGTF